MSRARCALSQCKESCSRALARLINSFTSKRFVVDTLVVIVLSWITGIINEVWFVGMPWAVSLRTRELATLTNLLTAGVYGWYYDILRHQAVPWLLGRIFGPSRIKDLFGPLPPTASRALWFKRRAYSIFVGYIAFITFQSQVYRLNLWLGGATHDEASRAIGLAAAVFPICIEFVFSPFLDWCRKICNVAPVETRE